jgi:hypothetical protein
MWPDPAASRRHVTLFPADDRRFRDAALLAVELFGPAVEGGGASSSPHPVEDERLVAAAQALLRAAYPLATILADSTPHADAAAAPATPWRVFRDAASLDESLLRSARAGNPDAVARLADRYQAITFLFAWTISGDPVTAATAVTEAMKQLIGSEEPIGGEHVPDTLLRLARGSALARRTLPPGGDDERAGARRRLSSLLTRLPASQSLALSLAYGEGLSEAEIALATGVDADRIRVSIAEGLAVLVEAPTQPQESSLGP